MSTAALKVLLAIVVRAENKSTAQAAQTQGSACMSYDELIDLTDLSRAMISSAVKLLTSAGIVIVKREGRGGKNRYFLTGYGETDRYGKIPNKTLYRQAPSDRLSALHELSCRRESDMNALKLYLLFCAFRDGKTNAAMIGYERIWIYTGIPEAKIRRAISVLIEHGFIQVDRDRSSAEKKNHPNRYEILGL
ncbi:hypothetical protein EN925_00860 [Mesorhizobium sp. M7A.F.Ca.US.006.04.2.1]|uniref:hypothetical protein n=1 Tax=unclassified Mesorhizobium TaxID=325217 RepID=UPI000FCCDE9E|nr:MULTISPECIES: hypothetical protein [unclassified Mesorhizobium]RUX73387.1 hypothetical protein EN990_21650 [Mesorhizobium sp. M7A.F.Ca.US.005.03.1.1]RUY19354.1 hypothetical protein EN991_00570 [Mesorhizobium sp. M7A.F.Ca.US.005.03.2.1]RVA96641.1 hypothetical protein EN925_00860 [Mesorhizobium sp. M7A.F.Ca.US.006.04.2.1]